MRSDPRMKNDPRTKNGEHPKRGKHAASEMASMDVSGTAPAHPRAAGHPPQTSRRRRPRLPTGIFAASESRISVMNFTSAQLDEKRETSVEEAIEIAQRPGVTWIDVDGLDPKAIARIGDHFGLHPLAIEDALNIPQRSKVESYVDYYLIVMRTVRCAEDLEIELEQVSLFFGKGFVVTIQERPDGDVFDRVREMLRKEQGPVRSSGADFLAYALLDAVCDGYFPVIETIGERIDAAEEAVFKDPSPRVLQRIQRLRQDVVRLRRVVWPMRDELAVLQRDPSELVAAETKTFLRDASDHAIQGLEMIETYREMLASIMEIYLSTQNQRLNEIMKVLTVIATVFIPLTFIASIYGMNFDFMPELKWRYGYLFALGIMAVVGAALITFFKRRGWW